MPSSTPPSVAFQLPYTHEVRHATSLVELLKLAGSRVQVGNAWGIALRTYDRRKADPGSTTVAEVVKLAAILQVDEQHLFAVVSASARALAARK